MAKIRIWTFASKQFCSARLVKKKFYSQITSFLSKEIFFSNPLHP